MLNLPLSIRSTSTTFCDTFTTVRALNNMQELQCIHVERTKNTCTNIHEMGSWEQNMTVSILLHVAEEIGGHFSLRSSFHEMFRLSMGCWANAMRLVSQRVHSYSSKQTAQVQLKGTLRNHIRPDYIFIGTSVTRQWRTLVAGQLQQIL